MHTGLMRAVKLLHCIAKQNDAVCIAAIKKDTYNLGKTISGGAGYGLHWINFWKHCQRHDMRVFRWTTVIACARAFSSPLRKGRAG